MSRFIVILEDDLRRREKMRRRCEDRFHYELKWFDAAPPVIVWLEQHWKEVVFLSLDHDLESPAAGGDPGTGRDVVNAICDSKQIRPEFPIIVHSSNNHAADGMEFALTDAGWRVKRVIPHGDLDWIDEQWFPLARSAILSRATPIQTATSQIADKVSRDGANHHRRHQIVGIPSVAQDSVAMLEPVFDDGDYSAQAWTGGCVPESPTPPLPKRHIGDSCTYFLQLSQIAVPLVLVDAITTFVAVAIAYSFSPIGGWGTYALLSITSLLVTFFVGGLYPGIFLTPPIELRQQTRCIFLWGGLWFCAAMLLDSALIPTIVIGTMLTAAMLPFTRSALRGFFRWLEVGVPCLIVGPPSSVTSFHPDSVMWGWSGLRPRGWFRIEALSKVDEDDTFQRTNEITFQRVVPYFGSTESIGSVINSNRDVFWLLAIDESSDNMRRLDAVDWFPNLVNIKTHTEPTPEFPIGDGVTFGVRRLNSLALPGGILIKRTFDIAISLIVLISFAPLIVFIAILIKSISNGPVLIGQSRIGRYGKKFQAWKFRAMFVNSGHILSDYLGSNQEALQEWNSVQMLKIDPRITRVGRFLRSTNLDKLPLFWNVLVGEMSLVGPRPIVEEEIPKYGPIFSDYIRVTPGITGLWQILGGNKTTYDQRLAFDSYYVANWSPWLDLYVLARTIEVLLRGDGAY